MKGDVFHAVVEYHCGREYCVNGFYLEEIVATSYDLPAQEVVQGIITEWIPWLRLALSAACKIDTVSASRTFPGPSIRASKIVNQTGARGEPVCPANTTAICTQYGMQTDFVTKALRRSNGWSGVAEADQDEGLLTTEGHAVWTALAAAYKREIFAAGFGGGKWAFRVGATRNFAGKPVLYSISRVNLSSRRTRRQRAAIAPLP